MATDSEETFEDFCEKYKLTGKTIETLRSEDITSISALEVVPIEEIGGLSFTLGQKHLLLTGIRDVQEAYHRRREKRTTLNDQVDGMQRDPDIPVQHGQVEMTANEKQEKCATEANEHDFLIAKQNEKDGPSINDEHKNTKVLPEGGWKVKRMVNKNVFLTSLAYLLLCECYFGINILQSAVFGAVGAIGMGVLCVASAVACVSIAPITISTWGVKRTMLASVSLLLPWMASHFYVRIYTIVPTAVLSGLAQAPFWTAPATFFTSLGMKYSEVTGENEEAVIARFFGLFFCFVLFGASLGCGVSSAILSSSIGEAPGDISAEGNVTAPSWPVGLLPQCGKGYCPGVIDEMMMASIPPVVNGTNSTGSVMDESQSGLLTKLMVLVGTHVGLAVLGLFLLFFTDDLPRPEKKPILPALKAVAKKMFQQVRRKRQLLMTPINIYVGLSLSFLLAEVSEAFVGCPLGVEMIGFALMTWGIGACIASMLSGLVVKYTGRIPVFTFCGVTRLALILFLTYWTVDNRHTWLFFFIPSTWAIGDGILQAQINAMFGYMFYDDSESTFAVYRLFEAVGLLIGFFANSQFCLIPKLYVMITVQIISWILYYFAEVLQRRVERKQKEEQTNETVIAVNDPVGQKFYEWGTEI